MAYDEGLAHRIRAVLAEQPGITERKMFGGLAFMLQGNMCCGIVKDELMVRVGPQGYAQALSQPHARELDFTGRPMRGMVIVAPPGFADDGILERWIQSGVSFAETLPAK